MSRKEFDYQNENDLDFEIFCHMDDLHDAVDDLFGKCKHEISRAYWPVRKIFKDEANRKRSIKRKKDLQTAIECFNTRPIDYQLIVGEILVLAHKGYTEGFPFELETKFHDDRSIVILNAVQILMDSEMEDALKILRGQHCQMYR